MIDFKKDRPILFGGPMVNAILEGRKTMTRLVVNTKCEMKDAAAIFPDGSGNGWIAWWGNGRFSAKDTIKKYPGKSGFKCPYGQPGDRLWVREAWRIGGWWTDGSFFIDYLADNFSSDEWRQCDDDDMAERLRDQSIDDCEKAGEQMNDSGKYEWYSGESPCRIRQAIHMPRWASRISLEITGVRVARLQEISEDDAIAEGSQWLDLGKDEWGNKFPGWSMENPHPADHRQCLGSARMAFANYYCRITDGPRWNSKHETIWEKNPWVWVVEFCQAQ